MDVVFEGQKSITELECIETKISKRKNVEDIVDANKKVKFGDVSETIEDVKSQHIVKKRKQDELHGVVETCENLSKVSTSPKKRIELSNTYPRKTNTKEKFIYGNYSQYYGYRNKEKQFHDIRLDVFAEHAEVFKNKDILDIGCNSGFITMEVAKRYEAKSIVGLDIDKSLINQAIKNLTKLKKSLPMDNDFKRQCKFPFNIRFVHGNYVLKNDVLLEIEKPQFDVILCLSITKWIHLNFGDQGLRQAFKRMFLQLKPNGRVILEAQPFDNYSRRKKMTETIHNNYRNIKLLPKDFTEFLLSSEVGFSKVELMGVPDHCTKGFKRPIQIFFKS